MGHARDMRERVHALSSTAVSVQSALVVQKREKVWLDLFLCLCAYVSHAFTSNFGLLLCAFDFEISWSTPATVS